MCIRDSAGRQLDAGLLRLLGFVDERFHAGGRFYQFRTATAGASPPASARVGRMRFRRM